MGQETESSDEKAGSNQGKCKHGHTNERKMRRMDLYNNKYVWTMVWAQRIVIIGNLVNATDFNVNEINLQELAAIHYNFQEETDY